ncbi:MAG: HesB/IscA family protein [Alphaproteobacteria bacterium]
MTPSFTLSESAVSQLLLTQESTHQFLRISVLSGGCSGLQYKFDLETHITPDDIVIENQGAKVVIDSVSYPFLENASLVYEQELIGSYFKIVNPNAAKSCGCGSSFAV